MTLIELLVVIVILTTIVGAAIPLISPSNDDRRLREAARGLNTYITGAQTRAIGTNRPYGIALKRLSRDTKRAEDNGACLEVFYVEQPQAYAGFDANSRACVAIHPDPNYAGKVLVRFVTRVATGGSATPGLPAGWAIDLFPSGMIRPGDVIEINGTRFELLPDDSAPGTNINLVVLTNSLAFFSPKNANRPAQILARPLNDSGQQINPRYDDNGFEIGSQPAATKPPAPYWALPSPYKVLRQPTPASDEPYQLPEGTAIDLRASGVGSGEYFYNKLPADKEQTVDNSEDILIMFAPEGRVSRVSFQKNPASSPNGVSYDQSVVDNLYLLVGRRENTGAPDVKNDDPTVQSTVTSVTVEEDRAKLRAKLNWLGGGSRWIVIGSQSGRIATIENAFVDMAALYTQYTNSPYNLNPGTEDLRSQQILAAREFTHEMAQLSGR